MAFKRLIILIPAFNEEIAISNIIKNVPSIPNLNQEIIVIDDGSEDNTFEVAKRAGAIVFSNKKNLGLGYSVKRGILISLKYGADFIAILDGDGQYNPKYIEALIFPVLNNLADLVIGNRFLYKTIYESSFLNKLGNKMLSIFLSKILLRLQKNYDTQSSYRAFNRKLGSFLAKNLKKKYNYAQEMFILASLFGFKINQIPVECHKRISGKSRLIKNPVIHIVRILWLSIITYLKFKIKIL